MIVLQRKIGDSALVSFSGRRSYIDSVLNPVLKELVPQPVRAPTEVRIRNVAGARP